MDKIELTKLIERLAFIRSIMEDTNHRVVVNTGATVSRMLSSLEKGAADIVGAAAVEIANSEFDG